MEHLVKQQAMRDALKLVWPGLPGPELASLQLMKALADLGFEITQAETGK